MDSGPINSKHGYIILEIEYLFNIILKAYLLQETVIYWCMAEELTSSWTF